MDSIHSWIDKEKVTRLAESLTEGSKQGKQWTKYDANGEAEQTPAESAPVSPPTPPTSEEISNKMLGKQRSLLAGASERAKSAGLIHSEEKPAVAAACKTQSSEKVLQQIDEASPSSDAITGSLEGEKQAEQKGTFETLNQQLIAELGDLRLCAIDIDGDILFDQFNQPELSQFLASVMKASRVMQVAGDEVGGMRLKVAAGSQVECISVHCTRGVILTAILLAKPLTTAKRESLGLMIRNTLNAA